MNDSGSTPAIQEETLRSGYTPERLRQLEAGVIEAQKARTTEIDLVEHPMDVDQLDDVQFAPYEFPPGTGSSSQQLITLLMRNGRTASEVRSEVNRFPMNRAIAWIVQVPRRAMLMATRYEELPLFLAAVFWSPLEELASKGMAQRRGSAADVGDLVARLDFPEEMDGWLAMSSPTGWESNVPMDVHDRIHCCYYEIGWHGGWQPANGSPSTGEDELDKWILDATFPETEQALMHRFEQWLKNTDPLIGSFRVETAQEQTGLPARLIEGRFRDLATAVPKSWHFEEEKRRLLRL